MLGIVMIHMYSPLKANDSYFGYRLSLILSIKERKPAMTSFLSVALVY